MPLPQAPFTPINKSTWERRRRPDGSPEDIATAAVWLAGDDPDDVVGATLFVDGGMRLYPG